MCRLIKLYVLIFSDLVSNPLGIKSVIKVVPQSISRTWLHTNIQWRQTDQSISAMALVVFLPCLESIVYRIFMLVHFIPQSSSPRPVGTGDHEASLAPL